MRITFTIVQRGWSGGSGSGVVTSSPAPAITYALLSVISRLAATAVAEVEHATGEWQMPSKVYLDSAPHGDFRAMPARGDHEKILLPFHQRMERPRRPDPQSLRPRPQSLRIEFRFGRCHCSKPLRRGCRH